MGIHFVVHGVPPKKDGANSMWRKASDVGKIKSLRLAASEAMRGIAAPQGSVKLTLHVYAEISRGDLDNFITGVCDGLMAVHPQVPLDLSMWTDLSASAHPEKSIVFTDDSQISEIYAKRIDPGQAEEKYKVELEWD